MGPAARSEARTHTITDTVLPTTQTTSPTTAHFQRYSPFTQWVRSLAATTSHSPLSPAPLGGLAPLGVRHADSQLPMLHNPHYQQRSNLLRNRSAWPGMKTMSQRHQHTGGTTSNAKTIARHSKRGRREPTPRGTPPHSSMRETLMPPTREATTL